MNSDLLNFNLFNLETQSEIGPKKRYLSSVLIDNNEPYLQYVS